MSPRTRQSSEADALELIALLNRDPVQPGGVTIYKELNISSKHEEKFAILLHRVVNRPEGLPFIWSGDPVAIAELTEQFLRKKECRRFWPWQLFATRHKWFRQLLTEKLTSIFTYISAVINADGFDNYEDNFIYECRPRSIDEFLEWYEKRLDAREELTHNLKHVIETHMEKEDFEYYNAQLKEFEDGKAPKPIWVKTRWAGYFKPVGTEEVGTEGVSIEEVGTEGVDTDGVSIEEVGTEEAPASVQDQDQEM
ncbi:hypothetical protein EPUS_02108 [Endocarpon pusillum Z07020]|uniref:Uncharacterized protein n=1 Tax=Endocarpon pusillum (strain Z07020 / HMAS-L-300199) TaxID=1263415 RepID=U1GK48_ENDPU|nr:uncharacterized protein EPUS_02108 [Endocarpon pusillum Z07020]ERF72221.1 hypothetical protein EPUS_02108 [Endocarpon pusillum Z07020]